MNEVYPEFFKKVPTIITFDPLAQILGTVDDGIIKFRYIQIVKAAGHSCPTVAGAFLMTYKALQALYPEKHPVRGEIKIEFKEDIESGVIGVISNVMSHITGAAQTNGFKGFNGRFARHSLMSFGVDIKSMVRFTRTDTNKSVDIFYNPNVVPASQRQDELMVLVMQERASKEELKEFGVLWQERVKKILIDNIDNTQMLTVI